MSLSTVKKLSLPRRWMAAAGLVFCTGIGWAGAGWLAAQEQPAGVGLNGILPASVPVTLLNTLDPLPETWAPWREETRKTLSSLYEGQAMTLDQQAAALKDLRGRLSSLEGALKDARYASIRNPLIELQGQLTRRVRLAEAILATLQQTPEARTARVTSARQKAVEAARAVENHLARVQNGQSWIDYLGVRAWTGSQTQAPAVTQVSAVRERLLTREQIADENSRLFLRHPLFARYEQAVSQYYWASSSAGLPTNAPQLREALGNLVQSLEGYEERRLKPDATAARHAFDEVRKLSADGGETVAAVVREYYLNYNMRIVASEPFLGRFVAERRDENGYVDDCILGAKVDGYQTTWTDVYLDLKPSADVARFDIVANGQISSNTQGVTPQATIFTQGHHQFTAEKTILFNGDQFWTESSRIGVNANNTTVDASTKYSHIPLLGSVARKIAISEAEKRKGESEAIARGKVYAQLQPRYDSEIDAQFGPGGKLNAQINESLSRLRESGLYPDVKSYSTSDQWLTVSTRLSGEDGLGGGKPVVGLVSSNGAIVELHETVMNNSADKLDLFGKLMTEDEFSTDLQAKLQILLGPDFKLPPPPKKVNSDGQVDANDKPLKIKFDETDPIRFNVEGGRLLLIVRAAFQQEGRDEIRAQIVTVPLSFEIQGEQLLVKRGDVSIAAVDRPETGGERVAQVALAGVIRGKLERAIAPVTSYSRAFNVDRNGKPLQLKVSQVLANDGWIYLGLQ